MFLHPKLKSLKLLTDEHEVRAVHNEVRHPVKAILLMNVLMKTLVVLVVWVYLAAYSNTVNSINKIKVEVKWS